jgi:hypothetical protein
MPVRHDLPLVLDADMVLRGQGADPAVVRGRSRSLVTIAEQALEAARPLIAPAVLFRVLEVEGMRHERLSLEGGGQLSGTLVAQHLGGARRVALALCTIGAALEDRAAEVMEDDPSLGLALDGCGSAAAETLANSACSLFESMAAEAGEQATLPLSPGMIGWPIEIGQPELLALIDAAEIGVRVFPSGMMHPRKSVSFVVGMGRDVAAGGHACDFCNLRETCRYHDHFE